MSDLELDPNLLNRWFTEDGTSLPLRLIRVSEEQANEIANVLGVALRRCYIDDDTLQVRAAALGRSQREILLSKLPDPGAVMAGDFGEIFACIFELTRHESRMVLSPKKWRLKQDRNKPAPHSDVLHFVLSSWPDKSEEDLLVCSEVKTKSTSSGSGRPIPSAISGSQKDRTSRLASTLAWLHARALGEDLGEVKLEHLERFLHAESSPRYRKCFQAVVCICTSVEEEVLSDCPTAEPTCALIVITIPELRRFYPVVFQAAIDSTGDTNHREELDRGEA